MQGINQYLLLVLWTLWLLISALSCFGAYYYGRWLGRRKPFNKTPFVAVIIPIRGVPESLPDLWEALCAQTYKNWRLIFSLEAKTDPAYTALSKLIAKSRPVSSVEIVIAGLATDTCQLNHNHLAAVGTLRPSDEIVVFSVSDIVPPPEWIEQTIEPLDNPDVWIVSAIRFLYPIDDRLSTAFAAAMDITIATLPRRPNRFSVAWGGTMALRHETLDALGMERWWRGALTDDLTLTHAIKQRGGFVFGRRIRLLPSPESCSWKELWSAWRRWYLIIRLYAPVVWLGAAAATTLPIVAWLTAIPQALMGNRFAIGALAAAFVLNQLRATFRDRLRRTLPAAARLRWVAIVDRWATPLRLILQCALLWASLFARTTRWGGRVYRVDGPWRVSIVEGPGIERPAGVTR